MWFSPTLQFRGHIADSKADPGFRCEMVLPPHPPRRRRKETPDNERRIGWARSILLGADPGSAREDTMAHQQRLLDEAVTAFLLEEYRHVSASFLSLEELGERRVNFYITLATALLAA